MGHDYCKIAEKLDLAHKWAHWSSDELELEDFAKAHALAEKIIIMLDEVQVVNGIKLLALVEVLSVGADHMEQNDLMDDAEQGTATVN